MLSERDAVKRESSLILSSACADERLTSALMAVEDLMVQLEAEKLFHKQTVNTAIWALDVCLSFCLDILII